MTHDIAPPEEGSTSESAAMAEIVAWSNTCPAWQRDALRRLCLQEKLTNEDLAELTLLCKDATAVCTPLAAEHVRDNSAALAAVTLKSLSSVQHVNALATGESLSFDKSGVTVLYGDNGSGKSGYARILKRACRARLSRGDTILPNIYGATAGIPTAVIEFLVNGQKKSSKWTLNKPGDPLLSAVSVFDSRTANVHVDQTNDVAYTPLPLKILAALAQACQDVKQRLNNEIRILEQKTPAVISKPRCQPGTQVGKLMAALGAAKPEQVETLAALAEPETARLATLRTDLASDPARVGRQLQTLKTRLDTAIARIDRLALAVGESNITTLQTASRNLAVARNAAQAASTSLFANEPLPEIGSDVWRALWDAARTYSETSGYPDHTFPVTDDEARCVLCLQTLSPEATDRMNRFEAFVKDESSRREAEAQAKYNEALLALDEANVTEDERQALTALIENDLADAQLAAQLGEALTAASLRLVHIRQKHSGDGFAASPIPDLPMARLRANSADLQTRSSALLAGGASDARKKLIAERDELADREWFACSFQNYLA
jgi:hypothetical protein